MCVRVALATLISLQTIIATPAMADDGPVLDKSQCKCPVQAQDKNGPVGSVEVTRGQVLIMTQNGYVPIDHKNSTVLFNGSKLMAGPRSEGKIILSDGCTVPLAGPQEMVVKQVDGTDQSLCLYSLPKGGKVFAGKSTVHFIPFAVGGLGIAYDLHKASR